MTLSFERDGGLRFPKVLVSSDVERLRQVADRSLAEGPGGRVVADPPTADLMRNGAPADLARRLIGGAARPVRAVVFDKTATANWAVAWHQDRTIVVKERIEVDGFGPWSTKKGLLHVAPPAEVLAGMATLRLHLDDCGAANAPLIFARGSHLFGRVAAPDAAGRVEECAVETCLAEAGDVWAYSTLVLHSSARAASPVRRRVLQVDYAAVDLPGGLNWRGIEA